METFNKIKLYEFNALTFDNVNIIAKEVASMINQSSSLEFSLRTDVLNHVYSEYKRLCNNQCNETVLKSVQTLFTFHLMTDLMEQRSRIEQIKKQLNNI